MKRQSRRHSTGFGYIGFGNSHSVFNQSANTPFSALKDKLDEQTHFHFQLNFSHKKLTKEERKLIKNKVRKGEKERLIKTIIVFIIAAIIIGVFINLAIDNVLTRAYSTPNEFLTN